VGARSRRYVVELRILQPARQYSDCFPDQFEEPPEGFDDSEDLAAYADELQKREDWEEIAEQIFALSDDELDASLGHSNSHSTDVDMAS
jgi:hypothetical protein